MQIFWADSDYVGKIIDIFFSFAAKFLPVCNKGKKNGSRIFQKKLLNSNHARISHNFFFKKIQLEVGEICSHQLFSSFGGPQGDGISVHA